MSIGSIRRVFALAVMLVMAATSVPFVGANAQSKSPSPSCAAPQMKSKRTTTRKMVTTRRTVRTRSTRKVVGRKYMYVSGRRMMCTPAPAKRVMGKKYTTRKMMPKAKMMPTCKMPPKAKVMPKGKMMPKAKVAPKY